MSGLRTRCRIPLLFFSRGIRGVSSRNGRLRRSNLSAAEEASNIVSVPSTDEQLQDIVKDVLPKNKGVTSPPKTKPKNVIDDIKLQRKSPLLQPIIPENQYEHLAQVVTPLCQIPYQKQLQMKEHQMVKTLQVLAKRLDNVRAPYEKLMRRLPCPLESIKPSPEVIAYRNKDEFGINFGVDGNPKTVGFYVGRPTDPLMVCIPPTYLINMRDSHKHIAQSFQNFICQSALDTCHRFDAGGIWRNLLVRSTDGGEKMATVVIHPQQLPEEGIEEIMEDLRKYFFEGEGSDCELDSLYLQACKHTRCTREQAPYRLIAGKEYITETCLGLSFQISPDAFFQVNTRGAEVLYSTMKDVAEVSPISTVLDICCGTGTISLVLAPHVRGTVGIDVTSGAVEDAKKNASQNNIFNTNFLAGKAEKILPILSQELNEYVDVIAVVNPARAGLHPDVIRTIRQCEAINKLVYISCKPEGFAMENFVKLGSTVGKGTKKDKSFPFVPRYAVPVDMFPHTEHTELVLLFQRVTA